MEQACVLLSAVACLVIIIVVFSSSTFNKPFFRVFISKGALVEERIIKELHKTS